MSVGRYRQICFLAALAVFGCAPRSPSVAVVKSAWSDDGFVGRRFVTDHFEINSTLTDAEFEAALPAFVEAAYRRYEATLPTAGRPEHKLTMYVFGTRSEWERFTRRRFPARAAVYARIRSGGFTEGDTSVSFFMNRSATLATLAHEGWHQYVGSRFAFAIPAWLNEGLACYHEAVEYAGSEPTFNPRRNTFRINTLREAVQTGKLLPLRRIVDTDAGEVISQEHSGVTQVYYAQAWALVTFLRHGGGGKYAKDFDRLLSDIADGTFPVRLSAAKLSAGDRGDVTVGSAVFEAYFGHKAEDLADEYHDHLMRVTAL
ncbi:MAG: DUF1570 domain-containing protein [Planctomycetota bacterium]